MEHQFKNEGIIGLRRVKEGYLATKACTVVASFTWPLQLRTSILAERMNEEIRRRERVIRIFPNDDAVMRLIGALLAEKYDEWQASSKYFDMMKFG